VKYQQKPAKNLTTDEHGYGRQWTGAGCSPGGAHPSMMREDSDCFVTYLVGLGLNINDLCYVTKAIKPFAFPLSVA
jgi:hypothetical protein